MASTRGEEREGKKKKSSRRRGSRETHLFAAETCRGTSARGGTSRPRARACRAGTTSNPPGPGASPRCRRSNASRTAGKKQSQVSFVFSVSRRRSRASRGWEKPAARDFCVPLRCRHGRRRWRGWARGRARWRPPRRSRSSAREVDAGTRVARWRPRRIASNAASSRSRSRRARASRSEKTRSRDCLRT